VIEFDESTGVMLKPVLSGGLTNYYLVQVDYPQRKEQAPYQAECEDLIEALGLTFDEANIFKEIWRTANARKGNGKAGNTTVRGAEKLVHYSNRILNIAKRTK
jgi:hypothetical protein